MTHENPSSKGAKPNGGDGARQEYLDFDRLERELSTPDLTRRVMGRLGYMRVSPHIARRHRLRQWAARGGTILAAALAVGVGLRVHEESNMIRRPVELTIPAAIGNDFRHQQDRIGTFIHTIRNLTPAAPVNQPEDSFDFEVDDPSLPHGDIVDPALLPFRWV